MPYSASKSLTSLIQSNFDPIGCFPRSASQSRFFYFWFMDEKWKALGTVPATYPGKHVAQANAHRAIPRHPKAILVDRDSSSPIYPQLRHIIGKGTRKGHDETHIGRCRLGGKKAGRPYRLRRLWWPFQDPLSHSSSDRGTSARVSPE
jgi:hypothetical protein